MAYTDLVSTGPQISIVQGLQLLVSFVTQNSAQSNIDITSWSAFLFKVFLVNGDGSISDFLASTPTLTGGSGEADLLISSAQSTGIIPGAYTYVLSGKNGPSDDFQLVARGTLLSFPAG